MSRSGIKYYSMDVDHIRDKGIKLLFVDFSAKGYWVWSCLVATAYEEFGYYIPVHDKDWITLFASDVCKMDVTLVNEVIKGCIKRGLFDEAVFNASAILTSKRMQENYLDATDRRKDERLIFKECCLIEPEKYKNLKIVSISGENVNNPHKNADSPEQIKLNEIKLDEIKEIEKDACANFFKIGLTLFEQKPSEYLFTNHRMIIESWMMTMFRNADLKKIFDQLDIECFGKDFTDDNHIKNCFKKIAERFSKNAQNGKNNKRINSTSTPEQGRDFGGF